ncbi:enoyl-CoA hydratase/isomerase family protein [Streptomyces sp. UNOB3_S3]|nr:enoyl-CoA hydratase/isomerase family protein [Streptomyces sp. UNOB3_S3]
MSEALIAEVGALCDRVEAGTAANPAVVLRLTGGPATPRQWPGGTGVHLVNKWERALRRLERLSAVTIAVADGRCTGPALEVLLSCDYRIGTPALRLALGTTGGEPWPGMALHRLANQLGVARARRLVLFGAEADAAEAARLGLVDEIADDAMGAAAARTTLARGLSTAELAVRRRLLFDATTTSFEDALGTHLAACDRTLRRGRDHAEPAAAS